MTLESHLSLHMKMTLESHLSLHMSHVSLTC